MRSGEPSGFRRVQLPVKLVPINVDVLTASDVARVER